MGVDLSKTPYGIERRELLREFIVYWNASGTCPCIAERRERIKRYSSALHNEGLRWLLSTGLA